MHTELFMFVCVLLTALVAVVFVVLATVERKRRPEHSTLCYGSLTTRLLHFWHMNFTQTDSILAQEETGIIQCKFKKRGEKKGEHYA